MVRFDEALLIECKPLAQIAQRNASDPGFFVMNGTKWVCPALQEAARALGMRHEVWCETSFSLTRLRNLRMLDDYVLRRSAIEGYGDALAAIKQVLNTQARANVEGLLKQLSSEVCADQLYAAISHGDIAFDWEAAPLSEQSRCFVYRDVQTLQAFTASEQSRVPGKDRLVGATVELEPGAFFEWDGVSWQCENAGAQDITIHRPGSHASHQTLPRKIFNTFVSSGAIKAHSCEIFPIDDSQTHARIAKASEFDLQTANQRHAQICAHLVEGAPAPGSRTKRRYVAHYRQAEAAYGNGYIGLLPRFSSSGNRTVRLMTEVIDIATGFVNRQYLKSTNINKKSVFGLIEDACQGQGLAPPSYAWFCRFVDRLPAYAVARARKGSKGAYRLEPPQNDAENIDKMAPERAFERAHIDHTLVDVETLCAETSESLGRCWLTVMIDHFSRRILAHYLTYDAPSYRSVLMVVRKCVQRHGRLPDSVVVDGGKEFQSIYMKTTCALYKVKIIRRPTAKARFGSQMERFFGTTNTQFFHFLAGNTQMRTDVRELTAEVDPDTHAVWTLIKLNEELTNYFYEVYDTLKHRELLVTPRVAYEKSMQRHGMRAERRIVDNELFQITTSPAPDKGTAKVQRDGVKIHYQYFYSPGLQRHIGKQLKVRYDPFDKSIAWAFVDGQWLRLKSRNQELFRSLTEHDVDLAVAEWRKRRSDVEKARLSEPVLVNFLKEIMHTETLLLARRRAAEERRIREAERDENAYVEDAAHDEEAEVDSTGAASRDAPPLSRPDRQPSRTADYYASFNEIDDDIEPLETFA